MACRTALRGVLLALVLTTPGAARAAEPGFTEPRRTIELAAPELGTIAAMHVNPGDRVERGALVCELDNRALEAGLAVARARRDAHGERDAAAARRALRAEQLARLEAAHSAGHARAEELARARAELEIAAAELTAAQERARVAALEYERIAVEIERRRIRSPIDATVVERRREPGEAVTPADHVLLTLAVLDPLVVRLNVALERLDGLAPGALLAGTCGGRAVEARVSRVAPVAEAASATVEIELEIDNHDGSLLSGTPCSIDR